MWVKDPSLLLPEGVQLSQAEAPLASHTADSQKMATDNHKMATDNHKMAQCLSHCAGRHWTEHTRMLCEKAGNPAQHAGTHPCAALDSASALTPEINSLIGATMLHAWPNPATWA